jgi:hypothetical protein
VDGEEVTIRQNLDGTNQLKAPKNGRVRTVILPPLARDALRDVPSRLDVPWLFTTPRGLRLSKSTLHYYWRPVQARFGRNDMDFYELRHFCATHLPELGVAHADVAVQLGHTDGGALVMSTYGTRPRTPLGAASSARSPAASHRSQSLPLARRAVARPAAGPAPRDDFARMRPIVSTGTEKPLRRAASRSAVAGRHQSRKAGPFGRRARWWVRAR